MNEGSLKSRVTVAMAQLLVNNVKTNVIATVVTATIVLLMLAQQAYKPVLIPWFAFCMLITVVRYIHVIHLEKTTLNAENIDQNLRLLGVFSFTAGCMWGFLGVVFVSVENPVMSVIVLMIFTGLVANASATMATVLPLYLIFILPIMVPTAIKFYSLGEPQYGWITALIALYLIVSGIATSRIRASLLQSVYLRFDNVDLIEKMQFQNNKTAAALETAEQANKAKSRFLAAASHDLRQPLQSLSMFTTTLAAQVETPTQKKIVAHMDSSIQSLAGLFNSLLDISSLDAGTLKLNKQHFHLKPHLENLAIELMELTGEKSLSLEIDIDDCIVYTDPILLNRIVRNLASNAVRYTQDGGVVIQSRIDNDKVSLSVIDTGIGIPAENRERIFDEFVQLNNPGRDREKGLGLGLSIVARICKLLDMQLEMKSVEGEGTEFKIDMDIGDESQVVRVDPINASAPFSLDGLFVLIIDDEEEILLSMEGLLSVWGCTVMVASSGQEAVNQLVEYGSIPDAVITDYRLKSNETGEDALKLVQSHCGADIPAIIITGDIAPERLLEIDQLSLPVLHKPCNALQLQAHLHAILTANSD